MIRCVALAGLASLTLLVGCGESFDPDEGVIVTGKLVQDGQPINNPRNAVGYGGVEVIFIGERTRTSTFCDDTGAFEVLDAGKGVPPGKYKVAVTVHGTGGPGGPGGPPGGPGGPPGGPGGAPGGPPGGSPMGDKLGGKLNDQNTKIEIDVPKDKLGGKHDVGTIEIATYLK
jgi:hypothetical protein